MERGDWGELGAPVLVGFGRVTKKRGEVGLASPVELSARAGRKAMEDAGVGDLSARVDAVAMVRMIADAAGVAQYSSGRWANPPGAVASALGLGAGRRIYGATGGDSPQKLVHGASRLVMEGGAKLALVLGGECFYDMWSALKEGVDPGWGDVGGVGEKGDEEMEGAAPGELEEGELLGNSAEEEAHGLDYPITSYPLLESAFSGGLGETPRECRERIGRLFSGFSSVASRDDLAWFGREWSAQEVATPSDDNRYVGFPYVKRMNAVMRVNQAAAILITTAGYARELGIKREKVVWLHGGGEAKDVWYVSRRGRLDESPAVRAAGRLAYESAGWEAKDLDYADVYSCFPVAVEVARRELGLLDRDGSGLTVTGGLPYYGGAGNAYSLMSICAMGERLREREGGRGICTANGYHLTKHAVGMYGSFPGEDGGRWLLERGVDAQGDADGWSSEREVDEEPSGRGKIVGCTTSHDRKGVRKGVVLGELESGRRFIARVKEREDVLDAMTSEDVSWIGRYGDVEAYGGGEGRKGRRHMFTPEGFEG